VERVAPIVGLASHLGRGVQRIATDAIVGRVRSLPRTIGDLDATALSQIMGRTVTSVAVIGGDAGTSSRARLVLTGDGVPESVFVKMPAETVATRLIGEMGRLAETETRFYSQLAPELTGVPVSHGSAFGPLTGRFVLVLEDLAVDPCEFPDTLHPLDADKAALPVALPQLATVEVGALYAYVAALITAGMGDMQAENIALEGLRRSVAALDDLDTVSLLEKSL